MLTVEQHHYWLDNLGAPDAPLRWFDRMKAPSGPAGWAMGLVRAIALVLWSTLFIWVWFTVFTVLFLWEGLGLLEKDKPAAAAAPAASGHH